jgi:hypothetical protein
MRGDGIGFSFPPIFLDFQDLCPTRIVLGDVLGNQWEHPRAIDGLFRLG